MILPMLSKVWQFCAETRTLVKKGFGGSGNCAYVEDAAEMTVSSSLEVYTEYTLPLLSGPGHHMTGPFFLRAWQTRISATNPPLNRAPFGVAHQ
jgi:hypothetical protein